MLNPTDDERSFLLWLHVRGGNLALQGNIGLLKIDRLIPEYVTQHSTGRDTAHFRLTEKGRRLVDQLPT